MISDTLSDAAAEIRDYLRRFPDAYRETAPRIAAVLLQMDGLRELLDRAPTAEPVPPSSAENAGPSQIAETLAAGAIIDVMMGGKFDWRSRLDQSDFLESADWQTALAYARAALGSAPPSAEIARLRERVADLSRMLDEASYADLRASGGLPEAHPTTEPQTASQTIGSYIDDNTDDGR
jgi:hypothetical protein